MSNIKSHIKEKFEEKGDPIKDLGIGIEQKVEDFVRSKFNSDIKEITDPWYRMYICVNWGKPEFVEYLLSRYYYPKEKVMSFIEDNQYKNIPNAKIHELLTNYYNSLNEKFTEDGDPIDDIGIGQSHYKNLFIKRTLDENFKKFNPLTYKYYTHMINHPLTTLEVFGNVIILRCDEYSQKKFLDDLKRHLLSVFSHNIVKKITRSKNQLNITLYKPLEDTVNEKFKQDSDPIEDLGIGLGKTVKCPNCKNKFFLRWDGKYSLHQIKFTNKLISHLVICPVCNSKFLEDQKIKESLDEKFTQDSDPIRDIGIGTYIYKHPMRIFYDSDGKRVNVINGIHELDKIQDFLEQHNILWDWPEVESESKGPITTQMSFIGIKKYMEELLKRFFRFPDWKINQVLKPNIYTKNESMRAIKVEEAYGAGYSFTGGGGYRGGMGGTTRGGFGGASNYGGPNMMYTYEIKPLNHTLEPLPSTNAGLPEIQIGSKIKGLVVKSNATPEKKYATGIVHKIVQTNDGAIKYYIIQDEATQTHLKIDPLSVKLIIAEPVEFYDYSGDSLPSKRREKLKTAMRGRKIVKESI